MDRRSWLWRRKSSDKSSGETESLGSGSGSMSSPSERFSDEQQVYSIQNTQSPEINLKHVENTKDSVKILSEKLSAAVATINGKEELVKQHAKVAEEAVTGWERAENEMNALNQRLDAATKKNSILEDKVVHLDGALKECLRQLRQMREEQDHKIQEAIGKKSDNAESTNFELQVRLADISAQLEIANGLETDLCLKLASYEKENASLKTELLSQSEVLELRTVESDLSTKRAETVSKQHLESIKKVAKLEAECRSLKAIARKGTSFNDQNSPNYFKSHMKSPSKIGFMDDFLEMEKLVGQPMEERRSPVDRGNESGNDNTLLKADLEAIINRTAELEERIEMVEAEKVELGSTLTQCQDQLHRSESSFRQLEAQFNQCQNQLKLSQAQLKEANKKTGVLQAELELASELRQAIDLELDDANVRREEAERQRKAIENDSRNLLSKVTFLEGEVEKERTMRLEVSAKCRALENELFRMRESKETLEEELRGINGNKEALEAELEILQSDVKSLLAKIDSLENEGENERRSSAELKENCRKLESELSRTKDDADSCQSQLTSVHNLNEEVTRELKMVSAKKEVVEIQLEAVQREAKYLLDRISSLELETEKERISSMEFAAKCMKLEDELSRMKLEVGTRFIPLSKEELNKQQEKELATAASKFAECQKTIASLGNQLKSLAKFEDLFSDSDTKLDISDKESQLIGTC